MKNTILLSVLLFLMTATLMAQQQAIAPFGAFTNSQRDHDKRLEGPSRP